MTRLHGILPALVSPVDGDALMADSLEKLAGRMYGAGCDGLYLCGNTGEGMLLPLAMREQIVEVVMRNSAPGKQVVVHVGAYRTGDAVRLTRHAGKYGATAISSLPPGPSYNFAETKEYYEAIAAVSDVPLLLYYFPGLSAPLSLDQIEELCGIAGVAGLKFTSFDLYSLRQLTLGRRIVFNGHDEVLAAGMLMGADGGIGSTYNLMPDLFVQLYRQARAGDWTQALATQDRINALIRILLGFPLIPAIKRILAHRGIPCGGAVPPRAALTESQASRLLSLYDSWELDS